MQVYERRPSGLGPELVEHARRDRGAAAFAAGRLVLGILLVSLLGAPLGLLWAVIGVALLASCFLFVRSAAAAAIRTPALVLTGRPKWDGTRRTSWALEADDPVVVARRLASGLDAALGPSLMALDVGDTFRGVGPGEAFSSEEPAIVAWGVGRSPKLTASDDAVGVWMRIARDPDGTANVTILSNDGPASRGLVDVARGV